MTSCCAHCGAAPDTRDHAPSKVLLDRPYPTDLPFVPACKGCNESFSRDEEYVACLVECVLRGSTRPEDMKRANIRRKLERQPALAARIQAGRVETDDGPIWRVENDRVANLFLKLAQAHAHHELATPMFDSEPTVSFAPLLALTEGQREEFEHPQTEQFGFWPEIGSRAFQRLAEGDDPWLEVQPERYRFMAWAGPPPAVRIVLSEYLAGEVTWADE